MGLSMGPCRVPSNDLAPADRRSRCRQMRHEPRLDPGYFGPDRTYGARDLLAPERAGFCAGKGAREIYSLGAEHTTAQCLVAGENEDERRERGSSTMALSEPVAR